ncbi:hypothetical protein P8C59_004797 [Phyllachora maydis]|uniref:Single-stranded DNA-binding protein n=1 Tax=Phyllachora maydis TaxID=1825666 RepID=A0AAD9MCU9_9PEZI|nr:hypothetical protein P8C59_004797 [Phyllachora maydis]
MFTYLRILARPATATGRAFSTTSARPIARMTIVGHLGIASNSGNVENRRTSWFTVNAFETEGPRRDFLLGLEKGSMIMVEGDVSVLKHEDEEGTKTSFNIIQRRLEILRRPRKPDAADAVDGQSHEEQQ